MSVYRCECCDCYVDADEHGCNAHPFDESKCVCDHCEVELFYVLPGMEEKQI